MVERCVWDADVAGSNPVSPISERFRALRATLVLETTIALGIPEVAFPALPWYHWLGVVPRAWRLATPAHRLLWDRVVELLEGHHDVGGDENFVVLPPA